MEKIKMSTPTYITAGDSNGVWLSFGRARAQQAKTRVQLELAPIQVERLNWLMATCHIDTRKDLFNSALSLFEWAVLEVSKGKMIASVDNEAMRLTELSMPALLGVDRRFSLLSKSGRNDLTAVAYGQ
jgi:hypothetical protein